MAVDFFSVSMIQSAFAPQTVNSSTIARTADTPKEAGVKPSSGALSQQHSEGLIAAPRQHEQILLNSKANARTSFFGRLLDKFAAFLDYKYEHKAEHAETFAQVGEAAALGGLATELIKLGSEIGKNGLPQLPPPPPAGVELPAAPEIEAPNAAELAVPGLEFAASTIGLGLSISNAVSQGREYARMGMEKKVLKGLLKKEVHTAEDEEKKANIRKEIRAIDSERTRTVWTTTADVFSSACKFVSKTMAFLGKLLPGASKAATIAGPAVGVAGSAVSVGMGVYGVYDGHKRAAASKEAARTLRKEWDVHQDIPHDENDIKYDLYQQMFALRHGNLEKQVTANTIKKWSSGIQAAVGATGLTASALGLAVTAGAVIGAAGTIAMAATGAGAAGIAVLLLAAGVTYTVVKNWDAIKLWGSQQSNRIQRGLLKMRIRARSGADERFINIREHVAQDAQAAHAESSDHTHTATAGTTNPQLAAMQERLAALEKRGQELKIERRQLRNAKALGISLEDLQKITNDFPLPERYGGSVKASDDNATHAEDVAQSLKLFLAEHHIDVSDEAIERAPNGLIDIAMTYLTAKVKR